MLHFFKDDLLKWWKKECLAVFSSRHNTQLVERPVVSTPQQLVQYTTINDSQPHDSSSTRTARHRFTEEGQVEHVGLEHKRQRLAVKGYDQNAVNIFLNAEASTSQKQYNRIQRKLLSWCELHRHDPFTLDPTIIVKYLAYGHHHLGWSASTCHLVWRRKIGNHGQSRLSPILQQTKCYPAVSLHQPTYDISPNLTHIQ